MRDCEVLQEAAVVCTSACTGRDTKKPFQEYIKWSPFYNVAGKLIPLMPSTIRHTASSHIVSIHRKGYRYKP